ncbi:penicillin-binding protein 2 [Actinospica sp. MGRD01-02]|uniref:Penicillin-binding protein 2 n=1 Tax=Actinospica acidithermotolerans TaxID=2828514 RepID=A0A941EC43_9ACTN|nr:penicillin-binding protein 2 [Actinospica acidithermotolerans]MBR7826299.1 penicillin-binding protein 2 [Actinospica acidithermotolerans]
MYRPQRLEGARARLGVVQVLVLALLATLGGRLWYLQVRSGAQFQAAAAANDLRSVSTPAVRGDILDDQGHPLVANKPTLEVTVDLSTLQQQPHGGIAVLDRLASVLGVPESQIAQKIRLCSSKVKQPCWPGSPYQPVPVATDVAQSIGMEILEDHDKFPGVTAQAAATRTYPAPFGVNAAQMLGYLSPVSSSELSKAGNDYQPTDMVGRAGLEQEYDSILRGEAGVSEVAVDNLGRAVRTVSQTAPVPGDDIVTTIDAHVQAVAEQQLAAAIQSAHGVWDTETHSYGKADSGAVVVLNVQTGGVVAMASYPTYDPNVWTGGINAQTYARLTSAAAGTPLLDRGYQGEYPPGSTFKAVTTSAMLQDGFPADGTYDCSTDFPVGNQDFHNFEGEAFGPITLKQAIEVSCDTVFYRVAYQMWLKDGGNNPVAHPSDPVQTMSTELGLGKDTGIDLPGESPGLIQTRQEKLASWQANKADWCAHGKDGYPDVARTDPARAAYLKQIAYENCLDGWQFRAGDAVLEAIGQGGVEVTPLQLARAYATIANGGTLYQPHLLQAVMTPGGKVVSTYQPKVVAHVPIDSATRSFLMNALEGVAQAGTASGVYGAWPQNTIPVGAKTGTADVYGQNPTSVFASVVPANHPQYAIVMMVPQGGQGAQISGPAVEKIEEAMYGVQGGAQLANAALLPTPPAGLPVITADGLLPVTFPYPQQWPPVAPPPASPGATVAGAARSKP